MPKAKRRAAPRGGRKDEPKAKRRAGWSSSPRCWSTKASGTSTLASGCASGSDVTASRRTRRGAARPNSERRRAGRGIPSAERSTAPAGAWARPAWCDCQRDEEGAARVAGGASLASWAGIVAAGRWTGHVIRRPPSRRSSTRYRRRRRCGVRRPIGGGKAATRRRAARPPRPEDVHRDAAARRTRRRAPCRRRPAARPGRRRAAGRGPGRETLPYRRRRPASPSAAPTRVLPRRDDSSVP